VLVFVHVHVLVLDPERAATPNGYVLFTL